MQKMRLAFGLAVLLACSGLAFAQGGKADEHQTITSVVHALGERRRGRVCSRSRRDAGRQVFVCTYESENSRGCARSRSR